MAATAVVSCARITPNGRTSGVVVPLLLRREARTMKRLRLPRLAATVSFVALSTMSTAIAVAQGTVVGTITNAKTNQPLQEARVIVVGTSIFTVSAPDGKYRLNRIPAGTA